MPFVVERFAFAGRAEWLAGAGACPYFAFVGPSGESQGVAPDSNAGEEMALGVSAEVIWSDIGDRSFIYISRGYQILGYQFAQPGGFLLVELIVIGGHSSDNVSTCAIVFTLWSILTVAPETAHRPTQRKPLQPRPPRAGSAEPRRPSQPLQGRFSLVSHSNQQILHGSFQAGRRSPPTATAAEPHAHLRVRLCATAAPPPPTTAAGAPYPPPAHPAARRASQPTRRGVIAGLDRAKK